MEAKEMFKRLGYNQEIFNLENGSIVPGIKYSKEIVVKGYENLGLKKYVNPVKYIEFYTLSKDMMVGQIGKFPDDESSEDEAFSLDIDELNAINAQILELEW